MWKWQLHPAKETILTPGLSPSKLHDAGFKPSLQRYRSPTFAGSSGRSVSSPIHEGEPAITEIHTGTTNVLIQSSIFHRSTLAAQ
jgi:hypothetical protein